MSLCKSYVFFNISNPLSLKYIKLDSNKLSSSVLKYISDSGFKNSLYFSNCLLCVSLFFLCFPFGQGLQKLIYILSTLSAFSSIKFILSMSNLVSKMFSGSLFVSLYTSSTFFWLILTLHLLNQ